MFDELAQFAARVADPRVRAIAERTAQPLHVGVRGRPGVGCSTVARVLARATTSSDRVVTRLALGGSADLEVYVLAEVIKPEDQVALTARKPVLVVLNKADLAAVPGRWLRRGPTAYAFLSSGRLGGP